MSDPIRAQILSAAISGLPDARTAAFTIAPRETSGEQIKRINRLADFLANRFVDQYTSPENWAFHRARLLQGLLDYEMEMEVARG